VVVAQGRWSRSQQWQPEVLTHTTQVLELASVGFAIALNAIYEGV
jgi:hypothetical protein